MQLIRTLVAWRPNASNATDHKTALGYNGAGRCKPEGPFQARFD
jgi:hypothetical protein